jgi:hypothetical protein
MSGTYLDYNASGLVRPEALKAATEALADNGNPSAVHAAGRRHRRGPTSRPWSGPIRRASSFRRAGPSPTARR